MLDAGDWSGDATSTGAVGTMGRAVST